METLIRGGGRKVEERGRKEYFPCWQSNYNLGKGKEMGLINLDKLRGVLGVCKLQARDRWRVL